MNKILFVFLIFFGPVSLLWSQASQNDIQLAQYYYAQDDYEMASTFYKKVFQKDPSKPFLLRYTDCLEKTGAIREAEKIFVKYLKKNAKDLELNIQVATFYLRNQMEEKGIKLLQNEVDEISPNYNSYETLINALCQIRQFDLVMALIEKGEKTFPMKDYPSLSFYPQRAKVNLLKKNKKAAVIDLIRMVEENSFLIENAKNLFVENFAFEDEEDTDFQMIESTMIEWLQKKGSNVSTSQLLSWMYVQANLFEKALQMSISIDKRLKSNGYEVLNIAYAAMDAKAYKPALNAFRYLVEESSTYQIEGQRGILNAGYKQITINRNFTETEIQKILLEYEAVLNKYGRNAKTNDIVLEYTSLLAYYKNDVPKAIQELELGVKRSGLTDMQRAELKMKLADIHVLEGNIWESSLLYMQIESDFKYDEIGDLAKFKNAEIYYFDGEFEYAQAQLDVLKGSTSKFISNDAIKLSMTLTDNYGLDSNYQAMRWFANAELLVRQHQYTNATQLLDSITLTYPSHALGDEILMVKANIMENQGKWTEACTFYSNLVENYAYDILADDALFQLGQINEFFLNDTKAAMDYYKKILLKYKDSIHVSESRKRVRILRGDKTVEKDGL